MQNPAINVITTTISGSVKDWSKVDRIIPLFKNQGFDQVSLHVTESHKHAREKASECLKIGGRLLIAAGGSGTFNSVVEGCYDSGVPLSHIQLGFLRKGSADLIGKVLGMPDEIETAIDVFVQAIRAGSTIPCDVIEVKDAAMLVADRHFVGYSGLEIFGNIPKYTENRYIKYYKGLLGQFLGDLGPFGTGAALAGMAKIGKRLTGQRRAWLIEVDGVNVSEGFFQSMIIVNGDLGPNLPLAKNQELGSGAFYIFLLRDIGLRHLPGQVKHTWNATVLENPKRWGFESFVVNSTLRITPIDSKTFPVNVDGSTMPCTTGVSMTIRDQIRLIKSL